ncbi:MAG: hypothetical protein ACFFC0_00765 [Promethearchaeota archaeon]
MKKEKTVLLALILTLGMLFPMAIVSIDAAKSAELPEYIGVDLNSGLAGDLLRAGTGGILESGYPAHRAVQPLVAAEVGDTVYDWTIGYETDDPYITLRAVSEYAEVWVAEDLSFPEGDPRNDGYFTAITDEMCQYLADQVSEVIYPRCTEFFGVPPDRDGTNTIFEQVGFPEWTYDWMEATDNPQRVVVKVFNIRDASYYDPTYPYYVIGFYDSTWTDYCQRNIIHLDCLSWWQRLGPEGTQWFPDTAPELEVPANYAFAYDGTTAHEYQHLIHHDYNPGDDSFMNEGCSMYAEVLCDYGIPWGHINSYLYTPDNSLTKWGDQGDINILADYGVAALWTIYLSDHFGAELLSYFVKSGIGGIYGINSALAHFGYSETFDDIYHNWRIANLIHSDTPGHGIYNYKSLDLADGIPIRVYEFDGLPEGWVRASDAFGTTWTLPGYDTFETHVGPYGSDYIGFENVPKWRTKWFFFNGDPWAEIGWSLTDWGWYSGEGDLVNYLLYGNAYVDPADPTLTISTYWDIEDFWDFGFVQVSTDDGATWTSLENEYTTYDYDPSAHPDIVANLPGLTSWSGFIDPDNPYAKYTMSFDLSDYEGQNVMIGFRYMTDWAFTYEGWYIDDTVEVSGLGVELAPMYPDWQFQVTLIAVQHQSNGKIKYKIEEFEMNHVWENGYTRLTRSDYDYVYLIVSPTGYDGMADYRFGAVVLPTGGR